MKVPPLHFENQEFARCGIHALNNVLGVPSQPSDVVITETTMPDSNGVLSDPQHHEGHEYPHNGWQSDAVMEMAFVLAQMRRPTTV